MNRMISGPSLAFLSAVLVSALSVQGTTAFAQLVPFEEQTPPPAPDYALSSSWAAGVDGTGAASAVAPGATPATRHADADVFFIHPTTFRSREQWNQNLSDTATNDWTDVSTIARQAGVFNACCRIFAPRYRQAAFLNLGNGREKALGLAYTDIEAAFDYFIAHYSKGRPFILAGHSQGGFMVAELLQKRIAGTPLQKRLIAAYSIGVNVAEEEAKIRFPSIPPCAKPQQTGCLLQWNAMLDTSDIKAAAAIYEKAFVDKYGDRPGKRTICANPITFDLSRPDAAASESKGAVPGTPGVGTLRPVVAGQVAASCINGMLAVHPNPALELTPLPGGSMHYHDLGLFYEDIRANAVQRVKAWWRNSKRK